MGKKVFDQIMSFKVKKVFRGNIINNTTGFEMKKFIESSRNPRAFKFGDKWCPERSLGMTGDLL
jgi:hypothetical protein